MAKHEKPTKRRGLAGYQGLFLALTLVAMMVIIVTTKDLPSAIIIIGLITNFLIISSQLTLLGDRQVAIKADDADPSLAKDRISRGLATSVTATAEPAFALSEAFGAADGGHHRETMAHGAESDPAARESQELADGLVEPDDGDLLPCGNDLAIAVPLDVDEMVTYQARSRNVPERVWAANLRRRDHLAMYVKEELDEEENSYWWGAHET